MKLTLDFETYSDLDISSVGGYRYAMHPSAKALMLSWKIDDGPTQIWDIAGGTSPPAVQRESVFDSTPRVLRNALYNPECTIHAFNANFERLVFKYALNIGLPTSRFRCSMVRAYSLSFSGGLDDVLAQFLPHLKKDPRGKKLMNKFSKPQPKNQIVQHWDHKNAPEEWEEYKQYCIQDTEVEYALSTALEAYPYLESEQELYVLDQEINDRGVPLDRDLIEAAIKISTKEKARLKTYLQERTGLANPNSNSQMLPWLNWQWVFMQNMQKDTVTETLERDDLIPLVRDVLMHKQQLAKTSVTKYNAFAKCICDDDRVRGMFSFAGAQRTNRWAGRIVQLHNLARGGAVTKDPGTLADVMVAGGHEAIQNLYGAPMIALSDAIRCTITSET